MTPRLSIVRAAQRWVGREESSRNQFAGIEQLWAATSYPDGWLKREPYCAAFVCWCVREAAERDPTLSVRVPPREASCKGWKEWARNPAAGVLIFKPGDSVYKPAPGDIVNYLPNLSHIGIVEELRGDTIATIEANSTIGVPNGSSADREGGGIYRKVRKLSFAGEFYRLPLRGQRA